MPRDFVHSFLLPRDLVPPGGLAGLPRLRPPLVRTLRLTLSPPALPVPGGQEARGALPPVEESSEPLLPLAVMAVQLRVRDGISRGAQVRRYRPAPSGASIPLPASRGSSRRGFLMGFWDGKGHPFDGPDAGDWTAGSRAIKWCLLTGEGATVRPHLPPRVRAAVAQVGGRADQHRCSPSWRP
jgi:hypothetical protein